MEIRVYSLTLSTLFACVFTAPVSKDKIDDITNALKTQLKDQEQALASLGALRDQVASSKSLGFSKSKSYSYSNVNGAVHQEEKQEEKVTNPEKHKLLSDMKEHVKQSQESPDKEPKTSFKASLDIPAQGIHKEISNNDEMETEPSFNMPPENFKDTIEFTPEVVAQYLYDHDAKQDFLNLLNELVDTSEITSEEAERYEKSVMDELYKIEKTSKRSEDLVNAPIMDQFYPEGFVDAPQPLYPLYNDVQTRDDLYPLYGYGQVPMKPQEPNQVDNYINYVLNKPVTLDDMINGLLDEWLTKAIVTGDPEAEEILTNIVDFVSRDNDPNDEEQVKAVLGDIFAEALLEDLTPRIEPQDLTDVNMIPPRPQVFESAPLPVEHQVDEPTVEESPAEVSKDKSVEDATPEPASKTEDETVEKAKMK